MEKARGMCLTPHDAVADFAFNVMSDASGASARFTERYPPSYQDPHLTGYQWLTGKEMIDLVATWICTRGKNHMIGRSKKYSPRYK